MVTQLQKIRQLVPMLDMAYQAQQLRMAKTQTRINELRAQLAALDRPEKAAEEDLSAATRAGADILWENWAQDRKTLINRELVLAFRDRENVKGDVIAALSKLEAARQMETHAVQEDRKTTERRSNW